jgi:hypothetical protein
LKKRTKKLFLIGSASVQVFTHHVSTAPAQKFFASFFQKIRSVFLSPITSDTHSHKWPPRKAVARTSTIAFSPNAARW